MLKTPLYDEHVSLHAKMMPFAGWSVPLLYTGIMDEHRAVRSVAGLFDVSHMGKLLLQGEEAHDTLQYLSANLVPTHAGKGVYTHFLREDGTIIDDLIINVVDDDRFLCVCNAATRSTINRWIAEHSHSPCVDVTERLVCLALQGPLVDVFVSTVVENFSVRELPTLGNAVVDLHGPIVRDFPMEMKGAPSAMSYPFDDPESRLLVSRTGYTGELGIEIFCDNAVAAPLWQALLRRGRKSGLVPAGLGARDTLRLEKGYLLSGQDFDGSQTPLEAGQSWLVKWDHDFIGRAALIEQRDRGSYRRFCGIRLEGPGIPRSGAAAFAEGREVGRVTSGSLSPSLGAGIALAYLDQDVATPDSHVDVEVRRGTAPGIVTRLPFV